MIRSTFVVSALVAVTVVGCGGRASSSPDHAPGDADSADDPSDAGSFACGDAACSATEVCVYPINECTVSVYPLTDAGICPAGTIFFPDNGDGCLGSPNCLKGFAPWCGAPSRCQQDRSNGNIVLALLDAGADSSRICAAQNPP